MAFADSSYNISAYDLLIFKKGRIGRAIFLQSLTLIVLAYINYFLLINLFINFPTTATWMHIFLNLIFVWMILSLLIKRLHDINLSGYRLLVLLIPIFGPIYLVIILFRMGLARQNDYGIRLEDSPLDYLVVEDLNLLPNLLVVNDITRNNPCAVKQIIIVESVQQIIDIMRNTDEPISIGGGRFSMGGQIESPNSIHLDMRKLNKIVTFSQQHQTIRVEAGIRWCAIQKFIDQFDLAVKIMQTYANFTVGGSISVNAHGRYMGQGPLILSLREICLVLANGERIIASATYNSEYFFAAVGGYGAIGVIVEAEFELVKNINLERINHKMSISRYLDYFKKNVASDKTIIMHNADIYPPKFNKINAVSWHQTTLLPTVNRRLQTIKKVRPITRYLLWAIAETPLGKWRRQYIIDQVIFFGKKVHPLNYEAGYDAAELSPITTRHNFWALQEYFIPIELFDQFVSKITEIIQRYKVNVLNISIRHAGTDSGSYLAWSRQETFAFVIYFKQSYSRISQTKVGLWTRELIDAAISCDGSYYLPYQIFATPDQFHKAYPHALELFELKQKLDPNYRLQNSLWNKYYKNYHYQQETSHEKHQ